MSGREGQFQGTRYFDEALMMAFVSYLKKYFSFPGSGTYIRTGHVVASRVLAMLNFGYVKMHAFVFKCASMYFTAKNVFLGEVGKGGRNERQKE